MDGLGNFHANQLFGTITEAAGKGFGPSKNS